MAPKIGIALSGGGVKGFAHLGVLKALEEKGIEADILAGISAGAIVGSFIAAGKKPAEVMELINENDFFENISKLKDVLKHTYLMRNLLVLSIYI